VVVVVAGVDAVAEDGEREEQSNGGSPCGEELHCRQ
jgi:hypothetical protein